MPKEKSARWERFSTGAFLFNAKDWFIDTAQFSAQEKGIYIDLLAMQWANKSIPSNPELLFNAVGKNIVFSIEDVLDILSRFTIIDSRNTTQTELLRDVSVTEKKISVTDTVTEKKISVTENEISLLKKIKFQTFTDCWNNIKHKFDKYDENSLYNKRLEQERIAQLQYNEIQQNRTKVASEKRWNKLRDVSVTDEKSIRDVSVTDEKSIRDVSVTDEKSIRDVSVTDEKSIRDGIRDGRKNLRHGYQQLTVNSNKKNLKPPVVPQNLEPGKNENHDHKDSAPGEKSVSRAVSRKMRAYLPPLDEKYLSMVDTALKSYEDKFLMHSYIYGRPEEFQVFLLEQYFYDTSLLPGETTPATLMKNFIFWMNVNNKRLERKYNEEKKDINWFNKQVAQLNGLLKNEEKDYFIKYYCTVLPSGSYYFQTLKNFNIKETAERWHKTEYKKIKNVLDAGVEVVPMEGKTPEEIFNHYKVE